MCNKNKESDKYQGLVSTKQLSRKQKSYRRLVLSSGIKTSIMQIWFSFFSLQQNSQLLCPAKPWRSGSSGCWRWHLCLSQGELHGHRRGFFFFVQRKECVILPQGSPTGFGFSMEALWRSPSTALLDQQHPWAAKPSAPQLPLKCP